jgi:hypothetical protein
MYGPSRCLECLGWLEAGPHSPLQYSRGMCLCGPYYENLVTFKHADNSFTNYFLVLNMLNELLCFLIQLKEVRFLHWNHCSACYDTNKIQRHKHQHVCASKYMHTHSLTLILTPTHALTLSCSYSIELSHTLSLSYTHSHTLSHTPSFIYSLPHSLNLLIHTHPLEHSHTNSLTFSQTNTSTHTTPPPMYVSGHMQAWGCAVLFNVMQLFEHDYMLPLTHLCQIIWFSMDYVCERTLVITGFSDFVNHPVF